MDSILKEGLESGNLNLIKDLIEREGIVCPISGSKNWTDVRQFNLMFATEFGAVASDNPDDNKVYLRPETAQGFGRQCGYVCISCGAWGK
jgi:glycyl-tRNA synthetase